MSERPSDPESPLIEFVRSIDVRAPEELHESVRALAAESPPGRGRRRPADPVPAPRWRLAGAVALALAAVVAVVLIALGGARSPSPPSLDAASALALRAPTLAAPSSAPGNTGMLAASVDGVAFPDWGERFGWHPVGARSDRLAGREVTTVFYADGSRRRIGYAIVAGTPPPPLGGGTETWQGSTAYRVLSAHGTSAVAWLRDGRLCIVSGRGVDAGTLLRLAAWDGYRGAAA
ncbi:MAG TPA: hypothetical protein VKG62_07195 [Solirubrobacteraceae bacterium]|nr:hypothetical protein [Solirubrobacteraceae bacterium]